MARVLGGFDVIVDGRRLERTDWQRVSAERLIKLLLTTPGHAVGREQAAETLWPEAEPEGSRSNMRKALHFARRALGIPGAVAADGRSIRLAPDAIDVDLDRLRAAFDAISRRPAKSTADGRRPLESAVTTILELGSQVLLPDDEYEDWLVSLREQLRNRWQVVALQAARDAASAGRRGDAHQILEQIFDRDPTDEAAHRLSIELYAAEGRHHAARRQYELCRAALRENLDADPSPETDAAYRNAERVAQRAGTTTVPRSRLVARQRELELLEPLLDRIASGRPGALVICGPAGIGKTRILEEVRTFTHGPGWRVLDWQAIESTRAVALAPFARRLPDLVSATEVDGWDEPGRSAVATVAPDPRLVPRLPFADRLALVAALVEALRRMAQDGPVFISVDDLPWLDDASVDVLESAVSTLSGVPVLVAVTYRDEESMPEGAAGLLQTLRRSGALELRPGPLALRDLEPLLLGHLGGESVSRELVRALFERSEGNPLFSLELARAGIERGFVREERGRWTLISSEAFSEAPETVRHLVARRSSGLSGPATDLLRVAAECGSEVGFGTLVAILSFSEGGVIGALDEALASGLLVERRGGYAFAHPLFRLAIGSKAGAARRGGTHLAIARALAGLTEELSDVELDRLASQSGDPAPIAEHALIACELGLAAAASLAVPFGFAAGHRARLLFDRPSATVLFERALACWARLPADAARAWNVSAAFVALAELRMAEGDEPAATEAFRSALTMARTPDELAFAYDRFLWLPYRHGDFEATISLCNEALARLPQDAVVARAVIGETVGWCLGRLHRMDEAVARLLDSAAVLEAAGATDRLGGALDRLGMVLQFAGRTDEAVEALERSLAIALELHDVRGEQARLHLGVTLVRSGRAREARPHLLRALELTHQTGDGYLEAVAAWGAAEMEDALGDLAAAREMRLREISLLTRVGGNAHNEALSHAHLSHIARCQGREDESAREAALARELAARDADPGYAARIERALGVTSWAELETD